MVVRLMMTPHEASVLRELLRMTQSELSAEIAGTDRKAYRDEIKAKRDVLQLILERLDEGEGDQPPAPAA